MPGAVEFTTDGMAMADGLIGIIFALVMATMPRKGRTIFDSIFNIWILSLQLDVMTENANIDERFMKYLCIPVPLLV